MDQNKRSVCLVAHNAYGALTGGTSGHVGGVERQTSMTAKWLAAQGWQVSMITWNEGGPPQEVIDRVRVIKVCRQDAGIPGLRFFWPKWTSLNRAMRAADADVYYQNCAEEVTGQVAMWCRRHGRKLVYSVANDPDVDKRLLDMHTIRERVLYRYGLRRADRIIVQTESQKTKLHGGFGLDSVVIPMPCLGPLNGDFVPPNPPKAGRSRVLWVARICEQKRPDRLVDLAEACPDLCFDVAGPAYESPYSQASAARLRGLGNVTVHGGVSRERMPEFYRNAACLLCTSDVEGFPNTFLEAWSHGLPVVSTFDPDGLIARRNLGVSADDVPALIAGLRSLLSSPDRWLEASANARRYYLENHTVETVMPQFERVFLDVVGRGGVSQG
jgi:glycosyltransferase involved in cell wall biosynthesis